MDHDDGGGSSGYQHYNSENSKNKDKNIFDPSSSGNQQYNQSNNFEPSSSGDQRYNLSNFFDPSISGDQGYYPSYPLEASSLLGQQTSQTTQPLPDMKQLSKMAASAVAELNRLFLDKEDFWIKSIVDGSDEINQVRYENFFPHAMKQIKNARIESSRYARVIPIEAKKLVKMLLDSGDWKKLFPTIVNEVYTVHSFGSGFPIDENCNVLQVIREQLHILSPLVPARDFEIVRCCQKIKEGEWLIADVSRNIIVDIDQSGQLFNTCYKRPSGCLIQTMDNGHSEVTWIEHVEVHDIPNTHKKYRNLLCGGSGYGAKRWVVTLERMCERMAQREVVPIKDRLIMENGETMLMNFNEILTIPSKGYSLQYGEAIISIRTNTGPGQPRGLVVSARRSVSIPESPLQVFKCLRVEKTRHLWDFLWPGKVFSKINQVPTGTNQTNCVTIYKPTQTGDVDVRMFIIQDHYMDALGGMFVYSLVDFLFFPCGFTISSNSPQSIAMAECADDFREGGTLLTTVLQKFVPSDQRTMTNEVIMAEITSFLDYTIKNIKAMLKCPHDD